MFKLVLDQRVILNSKIGSLKVLVAVHFGWTSAQTLLTY